MTSAMTMPYDGKPATIPQVMAQASRQHPEAVAIEDRDRCVTFAELQDLCSRMAAAFLAYGLRKGERIAVWPPNIPEWIVVAVGAQSAGGILVPLNTRLKGKEAGKSRAQKRPPTGVPLGEALGSGP